MGAPGFDNALVEVVAMGARTNRVTMVYPYYENPMFLRAQLDRWSKWSSALHEYVQVIIVDDGSPKSPAQDVLNTWQAENGSFPFWIRLMRIEVDVRWNWLAARNIGMYRANDGWCLLTDMDHVVPEETMNALVRGEFNKNRIYTFRRKEHTGAEIHRHPNSMFMQREMFWKVGGYDEALSGHYGTDGDWRRRCAATATVRCADVFLERHEYQQDSSTRDYLRKQPEDAGKKKIIKARGPKWKPRTLSFPYHEVKL